MFIINYNGVNLLSNTTIWWIYIYILHREQLHVSALDNGHLKVVHESLSKQLYNHIYIYICVCVCVHVVVLYVIIIYTHIFIHHIVVLDSKFTPL